MFEFSGDGKPWNLRAFEQSSKYRISFDSDKITTSFHLVWIIVELTEWVYDVAKYCGPTKNNIFIHITVLTRKAKHLSKRRTSTYLCNPPSSKLVEDVVDLGSISHPLPPCRTIRSCSVPTYVTSARSRQFYLCGSGHFSLVFGYSLSMRALKPSRAFANLKRSVFRSEESHVGRGTPLVGILFLDCPRPSAARLSLDSSVKHKYIVQNVYRVVRPAHLPSLNEQLVREERRTLRETH